MDNAKSLNPLLQPDFQSEQRASSRLLDVLIRASLLGGLAVLCYKIFSPFLTLMIWSIILAVTLYPLHQRIARLMRGKQWAASVVLVGGSFLLIIIPAALLMNSFADTLRGFIVAVQTNTLAIPPPREGIENVPVIGQQIHEAWLKAHTDLAGLLQSMKPKIGDLVQTLLGIVASMGGNFLMFIASFIVASIVMAYGDSGASSGRAIFDRLVGIEKGEALTTLSTATIRAVALGVIGVAAIQAILIGLALLLAGVPAAGLLSIIVLVLGILQVPALVMTLPVIVYIWSSGDYGSASAITHTIILLLTGMSDNILKPLLLGRGVNAPMPVILLGALGGMASSGILGMFVGATLLALGYQIFMNWVANNPDAVQPEVSQIKRTRETV